MPATPARLGRLGAPPEDDTAITHAGGPAIVVPLLAHLWRRSFDTDTAGLADGLTAHHHHRRLTPEPLALAGQAGWLGPDGIELVHRPGSAHEVTVIEEPVDGLYTLGSEAWPWESITNPGQDEDHI